MTNREPTDYSAILEANSNFAIGLSWMIVSLSFMFAAAAGIVYRFDALMSNLGL